MTRRLVCALLAMILAILPAVAEINPESLSPAARALIRLHVVADNDSEPAQRLKLRIRDAVLAESRRLLKDAETADEAYEILRDNLPTLRAAAETCARRNHCNDSITAETGVFDFPDRQYGGITVPAGAYRALRISIGRAEGRNWWCILYPTLCLPADDGFHSILLDWFERWFGGDAR